MSKLLLDPKNARKHNEANVAGIRASLSAHGQRKPIVVREGVVLAGNGTLEAARALGWSHLACVEYSGPEALARAYAIADNRSAELATWDDQVLALALQEADAAGLLDATAFSKTDADAIVAEAAAVPGGEDPGPGELPANPVSKLGEIYELGPHRLACGDSTDPALVAKLFGRERAGLMATDPPFGVAYANDDRPNPGVAKPRVANDNLADEKLQAFLEKAFAVAAAHALKPDAAWYLWHAHLTQGYFAAAAAAAAADVILHRQIIWVKPVLLLGRGHYHWKHEPCFMGWVEGHQPPDYGRGDGERDQTTVWEVASVTRAERKEFNHSTPKPTELFEIPAIKHLRAGEICYEPFAGSGPQIIAAAKTGRRCFAVELEPRFVDVCRIRWTKWALSAGVDPGPGALESTC